MLTAFLLFQTRVHLYQNLRQLKVDASWYKLMRVDASWCKLAPVKRKRDLQLASACINLHPRLTGALWNRWTDKHVSFSLLHLDTFSSWISSTFCTEAIWLVQEKRKYSPAAHGSHDSLLIMSTRRYMRHLIDLSNQWTTTVTTS